VLTGINEEGYTGYSDGQHTGKIDKRAMPSRHHHRYPADNVHYCSAGHRRANYGKPVVNQTA
jgi:type 1 glutamine amidotransferase